MEEYQPFLKTKRYMSETMKPNLQNKSFEEHRLDYLIHKNLVYFESTKRRFVSNQSNTFKRPKLLRDKHLINELCRSINDSYDLINPESDEEMNSSYVKDNDYVQNRKQVNKNRRSDGILRYNDGYSSHPKRFRLENEENCKLNQPQSIRKSKSKLFTIGDDKEERRIINIINSKREEGNSFIRAGEYQLAYDSYTEALNVNSKYKSLNEIIICNRILALMKLNRYDEALVDCNECLKLNENNKKAKVRKVQVLVELNRYDEAELCMISCKRELETQECHQLLEIIQKYQMIMDADNMVENCDYLPAIDYWNRILEGDSDNLSIRRKKLKSLIILEKYADALREANIIKDLHEEEIEDAFDEELERNRIVCLMKLERLDEALYVASSLNSRSSNLENIQLKNRIRNARDQLNNRSYYDWLQVSVTANAKEIRKQFHKLSRLYHSDKLFDCPEPFRVKHEEKFKILSEAYQTLIDPDRRRIYDLEKGL